MGRPKTPSSLGNQWLETVSAFAALIFECRPQGFEIQASRHHPIVKTVLNGSPVRASGSHQ